MVVRYNVEFWSYGQSGWQPKAGPQPGIWPAKPAKPARCLPPPHIATTSITQLIQTRSITKHIAAYFPTSKPASSLTAGLLLLSSGFTSPQGFDLPHPSLGAWAWGRTMAWLRFSLPPQHWLTAGGRRQVTAFLRAACRAARRQRSPDWVPGPASQGLLCFAACRVLFTLLANSRAAGPLLWRRNAPFWKAAHVTNQRPAFTNSWSHGPMRSWKRTNHVWWLPFDWLKIQIAIGGGKRRGCFLLSRSYD